MSELTLHNLKSSTKGVANKKAKRVGRGNSSGKGTTAGRGQKGQKSRSGVSGLKLKGMRRRLLSIPKLRGFNSLQKPNRVVNISDLDKHFGANAIISPKSLVKKGLIDTPRYGTKILSKGETTKAYTVQKCRLSEAAKAKIEKAGGIVEVIKKAPSKAKKSK